MRGTEVPEADIAAARKFLELISEVAWPEHEDETEIIQTRGDTVRLLAWYGSIRANGAPPPGGFKAKTK